MGKIYNFMKEEDRIAACKEYASCRQNQLSFSAEQRMYELDEQAEVSGLAFFMTNESVYNLPNAFVKPKYKLISMEQSLDADDDLSMGKLTITIRSGIHSDGFETVVTNGDTILHKKRWDYGYNCSYKEQYADERTPYVGDILQKLIDQYRVGDLSVEAGENVFARVTEKAAKVENFKNTFCTNLELKPATEEQDFTDAVANLSGAEDGLKQ